MGRCCRGSQGQGSDLLAVATALSVLMARGRTAEELELLATLFEVIGNNLSLLALKAPGEEDDCPVDKSSEQESGD